MAVILISAGCNPAKPVAKKQKQGTSLVSAVFRTVPLLAGKSASPVLTLNINHDGEGIRSTLKGLKLDFSGNSSVEDISGCSLVCGESGQDGSSASELSDFSVSGKRIIMKGSYPVSSGKTRLVLKLSARENADLDGKLILKKLSLIFEDGSRLRIPSGEAPEYRFARVLRSAGQDNVDTYRIPGLITTSGGTLIAVYDNRYNSSKDLQEDIDIGMSRSTDGGKTWEAMRVIMDMGEYGGRPQNLNGIGDPCILYDEAANTVWVAALWLSGASPSQAVWTASKPGMGPEETGQFMLVKSTDDGRSWSEPYSVNDQVKDPSWQLLLAGPGRGIVLKDGTIVFPAQFKAETGERAIDGGQYTCHSTIVYSPDHGNTWQIGTGAKPNTTESQVVELSDGSLMINMRDDRNRLEKGDANGRAVSVTRDMGKTWAVHPSSNRLLPEPNCQASLISADVKISGKSVRVLFFSNPNSKTARSGMTIKASLDEGSTWPAEYQLLLNQETGFGYSCLTMIDAGTIGVVYEGIKELYFQKIPVKDIIP